MLKPIVKFNFFLLLIYLIFFIVISKIFSHAILEYSEPGRRAVLYRSPNKIILTFNENIEENFAKIKVIDANDKILVHNKKALNLEGDKKSIYIDIPEFTKGTYFIQYEVISVDGHKVKGRYKFSIKNN